MSNLTRETRLALRNLRRSPGTTLLAVVVLALGIGGNSAMFNIVSALLYRPLAYPEPERLLAIGGEPIEGGEQRGVSWPNYLDLRAASTSFDELAASSLAMAGIGAGEQTRHAFVAPVTANYFDAFGVQPHLGRFFRPDEERSGARLAVLGHGLWEREGARPETVGSTTILNGRVYTVIGVTPPGFGGTSIVFAPDLWVPLDSAVVLEGDNESENDELGTRRAFDDRSHHAYFLLGRLRDGVGLEQADADVARVGAALAATYPEANERHTLSARPISRVSGGPSPETDDSMARLSLVLVGMGTVLLLVAGLNLTTIQSARGIARQREIAMRFALGSGRFAVVRQMLVESLLLALAAGALGLVVAWGMPRLLLVSAQRFMPFQITLSSDLDWRVGVATLGFCVLATLFVGLWPAMRATRPDLVAGLAERIEGRGARRGRLLARADVPVLGEIALSMVLLVAAGLSLRGALAAANLDPGFELDRQAVVGIDPALVGYDEARGRGLTTRLEDRLAAIPGVRSVASADTVPFGLASRQEHVARAEAGEEPEAAQRVEVSFNVVGPGYFETMGVPILRGRTFHAGEEAAVAVVDERLADRLWPGAEALGRRVRVLAESGPSSEVEVVGVVRGIRDSILEREEDPWLWLSNHQTYLRDSHLHLRFETPVDAAALARVRAAVREVDAALPVLELRSMRDHLEASLELWMLRAAGRLFAVFAAVALLLTLAGVYGVRAYSVARRSREIGVRMALGSSVGDTLRMVLREGMQVALAGSLLGLLLAAGMARLLTSFLYEVSASDPLVFGLAFALLFGVALVACIGPARRASRVDPLVALRAE